MPIEVRPATDFDDVATMVGPKRPDANVCWCLSSSTRAFAGARDPREALA